MATNPPDFDLYVDTAKEFSKKLKEQLLLEAKIKELESEVSLAYYTEEKYFKDGKPLPVTLIDKTVRYSGFNGELLQYREELAVLTSDVEYLRNLLRIFHDMIEVYRTESANERLAVS